jgi:hypothetical protein
MCELYAANQLAIPSEDTDWHQWGSGLLAIDVFNNEAVPTTDSYTNWEDWASALMGAVNPRPQ